MTGRTPLGPAAPRYRPGRRHEAAALVDRLRGGGACVVTAEPGGGRSAFLAAAARAYTAGPVVSVPGRGARFRQPLAALRALCRAAGAPAACAAGPVGDLIGALEATAAPGTLLLCVDDADRWDAASRAALGRLAARLPGGGRLALLLSVAGHRPVDPEFTGLPLLRPAPLAAPDAASLLDEAAGGALDPRVREEITAAAEGNPGLLLGLLHRLTPDQRGGRAPLPRPLADAGTLTALAGGRLAASLRGHRDLLLVTAAAVHASQEPTAEAELVRRATAYLAGHGSRHAPQQPSAPDGGPPARGGRGGAGPVPPCGAAPPDGPAAADGPGPCHAPGPQGADDGRLLPCAAPLPEALHAFDGRLGFRSALLCRTVYAAASAGRRRAAHEALARALPDGRGLPALLHRSWALTAPAAPFAADLTAAAADPSSAAAPALRCLAHARAAELTADGAEQAGRYTAAAEQALLAGQPARALRLLDAARGRPASPAVRARAELLRGTVLRWDGPVDDACETLLLAAALFAPHDPERSAEAALAAADAAWSAGDRTACLRALAGDPAHGRPGSGAHPALPDQPPGTDPRLPDQPPGTDPGLPPRPAGAAAPSAVLRDHRAGLRAVLEGRFDQAAAPLRRVADRAGRAHDPEPAPGAADDPGRPPGSADDCERLLRAASAGLLLGDVEAARRAGARALAAARTHRYAVHEARALEYLAYSELRAGRHALARTHAEEGLRSAYRTGQTNTAAHHHAVLALAASIEGEAATVAEHATDALATARRHGLAQAAALSEWATARADLGHGRPREAAERLRPLVRPGRERGHFAVWMLAVPCYVEACALAGLPDRAQGAVEDLARWAACDADPQAPAQLLRCRALLAPPDAADPLYRQALRRHEEAAGVFERARTELLYGKWLRRRRRLREARHRLQAALLGFERCGARPWVQQAAAELRANGVAGTGGASAAARAGLPDGLARLTPQQLRIARGVAQGLTNREVALCLSVSTRTVDYHLRNVFAALGVRSRVELARLVEQAERTVAHP
ncbi:LuxR C-terminal-related transcriptional regulator [Streptomyces sp. NPDC006193]|uniref:helix-turn-helix transcriptional regulator n=1 Tax=Streptomyces sp. NPDC006193 TaxID=3155717 RepID=UPI0033A6C46B